MVQPLMTRKSRPLSAAHISHSQAPGRCVEVLPVGAPGSSSQVWGSGQRGTACGAQRRSNEAV